jgi:DNA-damage-inducible protein J
MTNNTGAHARIDERTKKKAAAVLGAMGRTLSDAFRLLVKRIAAEKALPFERVVPNERTIAAMREAHAGKLPRFRSTKDSAAGAERARLNAPDADSNHG